MTREEIDQWIALFAAAAERAMLAGMDMIMLHGGHGLLISNFFSPLLNHRRDYYGGSLANRARFACELLDAVRAKVGSKLAIEFRLSAEEIVSGGVLLAETIELVKIIEDKIDLLHVSAGFMPIDELVPVTTQPAYFQRGYNVHYAASLKRAGLKIPVVAVGSLDMDLAAEIIEKGEADICSMIRTVMADPACVDKARTGREKEIRPCIRCVLCLNRTHGTRPLRVACAVNPRVGRELELRNASPLALEKKKVVVIGGGPAGMEAARTAASRGHQVVLMEKNHQLGGTLRLAVFPEFKQDLKAYLKWAVGMTLDHPNIDIRLGTEATPELVRAENPDAVIVAVGAEPLLPPIPGLDGPGVVWVGEVEAGRAKVGTQVVVAGGGLTGCETALHLARQGKQVTITEMVSEKEMRAVSPIPMTALLRLLREAGVKILTGHKLAEVKGNKAILAGSGGEAALAFDTLILSLGVIPRWEEAQKFANLAGQVFFGRRLHDQQRKSV
jgi:NADPH-dependent 2,4-dienoyl-CoA reductase/sulfur reductase-like enzyme